MAPQQMIEHLIENVQYTNGKLLPTCNCAPEEALEAKLHCLDPDFVLSKNNVMGVLPGQYTHANLSEAIIQ
jgi:hypothetical protein